MTDPTMMEWVNQYRAVRGTYDSFAHRLSGLLSDLLRDEGVDIAQIEARAKDVDSFRGKVTRPGKNYIDPLNEVTDLAAVRLIAYYAEDVGKIGEIIRSEFEVDDANTVDKSETLDPDRFGYTSVHYIIWLGEGRASLREWRQFATLRAEVQVRTVLQHAWAAVNHKLDYKSATEAPREVRRQLFRLSALFELADEQFSRIRDASARIADKYESDLRGGNFDLPLNAVSLAAYFEAHPELDAFAQELKESGISVRGIQDIDDAEKADVRRRMLTYLESVNVKSISELHAYVNGAVRELFRRVNPDTWTPPNDVPLEEAITRGLILVIGVKRSVFDELYDPNSWENYEDATRKYGIRR
ncbi:hypothetical protein AB0I37_24220 [Micromonospora purpureochromogenes]|uniref:GTP pyrophosphokinase n=1 Tax=Micromonospora purpureochromogenes TaxID=47872 RepID=UPI0033CC98C2